MSAADRDAQRRQIRAYIRKAQEELRTTDVNPDRRRVLTDYIYQAEERYDQLLRLKTSSENC